MDNNRILDSRRLISQNKAPYKNYIKNCLIAMKRATLIRKLIIISIILASFIYSTKAGETPVTIKPYGYVSYEILYDTYRSHDTRDGELYLFPQRPVFDINGNDINKRSKLNMLAVQSRFGINISGPDVFGAQTTARIEADFFATHQDYVRLLRLRHAFVRLQWESTELILGNTFHPTFVLDCFPSTVSFAAAVPFHPLNRSPQIRLTQDFASDFSASVSFLMHGYHNSAGPNDQQRNSGLPDSQLQLRYNPANLLLGVTAGYKFLSPRDVTGGNVATSKNVGSYNLQAFSKITTLPVTMKFEALYGENMSNFVMIGGYGAKGTPEDGINPDFWNSDYDYANLKTLSLWTDIHSNSKVLQWGLFAGYTENLGSDDPFLTILGAGLLRYADLHYLYRVSPRLTYFASKNFSFGAEVAYYSAVYAEEFDIKRKPTQSMDPAINYHTILFAKYTF
ncbi:MAG: hypothetical protein EA361_08500 [Bacteroidetes bacterium]|nr:MAG: hypothetical protein EA361_08500 [Bacteroidota bacterium]